MGPLEHIRPLEESGEKRGEETGHGSTWIEHRCDNRYPCSICGLGKEDRRHKKTSLAESAEDAEKKEQKSEVRSQESEARTKQNVIANPAHRGVKQSHDGRRSVSVASLHLCER